MHNVSRQKYSRIHFQNGPFRTQILHNDGQLLMPTYGWNRHLADTAPKTVQFGILNVPLDVGWLGRHCS